MPGGTTAHTLAPSEEALDTPLSPPPLDDGPGPATGLSGDYPDGTFTRRAGPAFRTQHDTNIAVFAIYVTQLADIRIERNPLDSFPERRLVPSTHCQHAPLTLVAGDQVKVFAWYDNEWGSSNRLVDLSQRVGA